MTLEQIAEQFAAAFETDTRNDGTRFAKLKGGSPEWMTAAVHAAHGDIMPDDWIYDKSYHVVSAMNEDDPRKWDDLVSEWADGLVDVYNSDRAAWLACHLDFGGMVDEAVEELGHSDQGIYGDIGIGQYRAIEQIAFALISAVREQESDEE